MENNQIFATSGKQSPTSALQDRINTEFDSEYVKNYERNPDNRIDRLLPLIPLKAEDVVCDYGCGNGKLLERIYSRIAFYYGVDPSRHFIETAKRMQSERAYSHAEFICSDIVDFGGAHKDMFTKAFLFDVSPYLPESELSKALQAIRSTLIPSADLYLHVVDANYVLERIKRTRFGKYLAPGYIRVRNSMTGDDYVAFLNKLGYREVLLKPLPHYNLFGAFHMLRHVPKLGKYFTARFFISCKK
jgi:2-polyprenyl-6-hydroxyphenyl methylase / 3-demethylubiquinone-9 3-methyltransferase